MKLIRIIPYLLISLVMTACLKPPETPELSSLTGGQADDGTSTPVFQVSSISPSGAAEYTSTNVTIYGQLFEEGMTVTVGGVACSTFNYVSDTEITCTTSSTLASGTYNVVVDKSGGASAQLTNGFSSLAAPSVSLSTSSPTYTNQPIDYTATFSEGVTGFSMGDIMTTSGSIHDVTQVSDSVYTFRVTPGTDGAPSVDISANATTGILSGLNSTASNTVSSVTYDTTPPTCSLVNGVSGIDTNSSTETFDFSCTDAIEMSDVDCRVDGSAWGACTSLTGTGGSRTISHTASGLLEGNHSIDILAVDSAGNTYTLPAISWYIDLTDPVCFYTTPDNFSSNVITQNLNFTCTDSRGVVTTDCDMNSGGFATCSSTTNDNHTSLTDGAYIHQVMATDPAGNTSVPVFLNFTIDLVAPTCSLTSPPTGTIASSSETFNFTCSDGTIECQLDGGAWNTCTTGHIESGLIDGSHTFTIRSTDDAGNVSTTDSTTWTVDITGPVAVTNVRYNVDAPMDNTKTPVITWDAATDALSTVSGYEMSVYKKSDDSLIVGYTGIGNVLSHSMTASLDFGIEYYVKVRGIDSLGNVGTFEHSPIFTADFTEQKITEAAVTASAMFGSGTVVKDNKLAIGIPSNSSGADAYVIAYTKAANVWNKAQEIRYSSTALAGKSSTDYFGFTVSMSGNFMAISAPFFSSNKGAVFLYKWNGSSWDLQAELVGPENAGKFGQSTSLTDDHLVVSAPGVGRVYVYEKVSDTNWPLDKTFVGPGGAGSKYGISVSLTGNHIFIGAPEDNSLKGRVFVSELITGSFVTPVAIPDPAGGLNALDFFGKNISASGNRVAIGIDGNTERGAVYIYEFISNAWVEQQRIDAYDGASTDHFAAGPELENRKISLDGDNLLIGAPKKDPTAGANSGTAYLYKYNPANTSFVFKKKIFPSDGEVDDAFGTTVSMSQGDIVVFSKDDDVALNAGAVYYFQVP